MSIEQLAIQASRERLIPFCLTYDKNYIANWHHKKLAEALEAVERGEILRLIVEMPPRHGKSQLGSIDFPAWYLGRNPDKEIITASYSGELARDFGGKTRDVINDPQYQAIFTTRLKADSKSKDKWRTQEGGSYTSVGIGGPITGRGAHILLIDDPFKNREEAESRLIRDKIWDWYTSTAYTRLEKGGAVIVIMTRWHTDDLVGRLLDRQDKGGDQWVRVRFPAIAQEQEEHRDIGEALWSEKYDLAALQNIKANVGIYDWQALYQQNPVASETQEFRKEWIRYYEDHEIQNKDLYYYTMVDLAGEKEDADHNAIVTIAKQKHSPEIYVVDTHYGHFSPGEVIDYLFHLKHKYGYRWVRCGIEMVAYQRALQYFIIEEQKKRNEYFQVVELKAKGAKETRIRGLLPMYQAGVIYHKNTMIQLEEEQLTFPRGKNDDVLDALAYFPQVVENTRSTQKQPYTPNFTAHQNRLQRRY